jgi:hypothetical protein
VQTAVRHPQIDLLQIVQRYPVPDGRMHTHADQLDVVFIQRDGESD